MSEEDGKLMMMMKPPSSFTPQLRTEVSKVSFRFKCPGPGKFQCSYTGLVFVMEQEAELVYRTVQWDVFGLEAIFKTPAGPLFNIECPDEAISELHLPHCEIGPAPLSGLLLVAHVTDDGTSIVAPQEITGTHVIVKVPHLSSFGLVWSMEHLWGFWNNTKEVNAQVYVFLAPSIIVRRQSVYVHLLPSNVNMEEVKMRQENCVLVHNPPSCRFTTNHRYTVHCEMAELVQPEKTDFDLEYGPNFHPRFEIVLPEEVEEATVEVRDQTETAVWKCAVKLLGLRTAGTSGVSRLTAQEKLGFARAEFIQRVSEPVVKQVLNKLLQAEVLTYDEKESAAETPKREDKAQVLIDMVQKKGSEASSKLIKILCESDPFLSRQLKLG